MPEEYPAVQGGGSLILAWQIRNKQVLIVGGGDVGSTSPYQSRWRINIYTGGSWPDPQCPERRCQGHGGVASLWTQSRSGL